jgi:retron-type reverse transcriptase
MTEPVALRTPAKSNRAARQVQSTQARKAHSLIGQVYDPRNLSRAWERVKENRGAGGVDGMIVARFEENRDHYLGLLYQKLKDGSYKPRPVLRVEIERPGSTAKRPLGCKVLIEKGST